MTVEDLREEISIEMENIVRTLWTRGTLIKTIKTYIYFY